MEYHDIDYYMQLAYPVIVYWDEEDQSWYAKFPDLPGSLTDADHWEDLPAMIEEAKRCWIEGAIKTGDPIPEPSRP